MPEISRVSSGIPGLDELLEGGLPADGTVLVSGAAGTGKTILGLHFLYNGLKKGENCAFISLKGEEADKIIFKAQMVGMDIEQYVEDGKLTLRSLDPSNSDVKFFNKINNILNNEPVDRVVIDSLSVMLGEASTKESVKRKLMYKLKQSLDHTDATTILTSELEENNADYLSRYGVAEHEVEGVIILDYSGVGETSFRNMEIRKMEGTSHASGAYEFEINDNGINVESHAGI
jgi:KaiC/GvpD/RAD55 family RecA-like ATPase